MTDEVIAETGFVSGTYFDYYQVHVLVAFTDQDMPDVFGLVNMTCKAVLIEETYLAGVGQATDNVLQHELSHLYGAQNHSEPNLMCVMNMYPYYISLPYGYYVPTALVTNNWCSDCAEIIASNRTTLGEPLSSGGGGGGGQGPYPTPYSQDPDGE